MIFQPAVVEYNHVLCTFGTIVGLAACVGVLLLVMHFMCSVVIESVKGEK